MPAAGFESAISATKRPQTYAFDCAATGIRLTFVLHVQINASSFIKSLENFVSYTKEKLKGVLKITSIKTFNK
jgi:hypothetical protein